MSGRQLDPDDVAWGPSGLVPAVVQDAADGRVLMVAYVDAEALAATLSTGLVHFHSRSRDRLWRKGETSGNVLRLVDIAADCDGDALLLRADPAGPTCHRNTRSCFDAADAVVPAADPARGGSPTPIQGFAWLEILWATIDERAIADPVDSVHGPPGIGGSGRPGSQGRRRSHRSRDGGQRRCRCRAGRPGCHPRRPDRGGGRPAVPHTRRAARAEAVTGRSDSPAPRASQVLADPGLPRSRDLGVLRAPELLPSS